jgi:hypothetical protein
MNAKDYFLNYHAVVQHGNRESTLRQRPVLSLGKQAGRDETSYMKTIIKFLKKKTEDREHRKDQ